METTQEDQFFQGVLISCSSPKKEKFAVRDAYKLLNRLYMDQYRDDKDEEIDILNIVNH